MIRPVYFTWIVVPMALYLIVLTIGLPHLNWSYDFRSSGGHDPWADRYYLRCTYIGPFGAITIYPLDGQCSRIKFFTQKSGRH